MNQKQVLILFHGMGQHTAKSFKAEVLEAANNAIQRYPSYKDIKFEDKVIVESLQYDSIFERNRKKLASSATSITDTIKAKLPNANIPSLVSKLLALESKLADDKFAYSHILDVILYITIIGGEVRAKLSADIAKIIQKHPDAKINILAHSLGTAVCHDTLNILFTEDPNPSNGQLPIASHKINAYWTFANVSRIISSLSGFASPFTSIVKPGEAGCVTSFHNAYNKFDPFVLPMFKRFSLESSQIWLPNAVYKYSYHQYATEKVSRVNTHSVQSYIEDPLVCHDFLNHFFSFLPNQEETTIGDAAYQNVAYYLANIQEHIRTIGSFEDVSDLLLMMKEFKDFLKEGNAA